MRYLYVAVVFVFFLVSCRTTTYVADIDTSMHRVGGFIEDDSTVVQMIAPYKNKIDTEMNRVIANMPRTIHKARPNSSLGNWFCDILLSRARSVYGNDVDMAIQNYGGLRVPSIAKGELSVGDIYELMPFDNELVVLTMSGEQVIQLFSRIMKKGGWPLSGGTTVTYSSDEILSIRINDEIVDNDKVYKIALPDYIANGGDGLKFLKELERMDEDILLRDEVIRYLSDAYRSGEAVHISDEERYIEQ